MLADHLYIFFGEKIYIFKFFAHFWRELFVFVLLGGKNYLLHIFSNT